MLAGFALGMGVTEGADIGALFSLLVASSCSLLNQPRKDRRAGMQWLGLPWRSDLCRLSESGLHAHLHAGNGRMLGWGGLHPA